MADLEWTAVAAACRAPAQNVCLAWPLIVDALKGFQIGQEPVQMVAAATVAVETGDFLPKRERRANAKRQPDLYRQQDRYWDSGFYGRGYIQLTWEQNYRAYGERIGVDLVAAPDLAMEPATAARLLAAYFLDRNVHLAALKQDWPKTRRLVNGGLHGWDTYSACLNRLRGVAP